MGRRALPRIDSTLELGERFRSVEQLPRPWNAEVLFSRGAPLEVELGTGKGLFLRSAAAAQPQTNFLGLEIAQKYARFAAAALVKRGLTNAVVAHGDGLRVFSEILPDESVQAVHVYFPDPWWKKRHKKRRVMRESFLHDVQRVLVPGGSLHFWSDVEEYYRTSLELLAEHTSLVGPLEPKETPAMHDMDYRTHFERRMRQHGMGVYRAEFHKTGPSGTERKQS